MIFPDTIERIVEYMHYAVYMRLCEVGTKMWYSIKKDTIVMAPKANNRPG
ncbi:hypothetical protein XYCOK13_18930 [Xylanibacillus composti]|uniref:Uncharacterized protein n=1 Tax=Xylanibacillus composti TaxID=1572762 RepID=A0A8J4H549_9BACL|nr:hypothetical protein XYCOK13_18930 [Xylanibacillus composti]